MVRTWHVEMKINLCVLSLLEEVSVALETSLCGKSSVFVVDGRGIRYAVCKHSASV